jgi:hypothetical protein
MTSIADKALILRISNSANKLDDLIDTVIKKTDVSPSVLDALDRRILETIEQSYVAWATVIPYLRKYVRSELFKSMNEKHPTSGYELAELFKAGYGGDEVEHKLCDSLYEVFPNNGNPLRSYILDALKERGQTESLEMLEVIKYELNPDVKTKRIVAKSILEEEVSEDDPSGIDKTLYMLEFQALFDFSKRVNSAIELILLRGVSKASISTDSLQVNVKVAGEAIQSTVVNHVRQSRVDLYFSKAKSLLPEHPPESLNNMRKAAEAICKDILDETYEKKAEGKILKPASAFTSLEDMVQELKRRKQISIDIEKYLASLQSFGNFGSHDQELDPEDISREMAGSILLHLKAVVDWYKAFDPSSGIQQTGQ